MVTSRNKFERENKLVSTLLEQNQSCFRCVGRLLGKKGNLEIDSSILITKYLSQELISQTVESESCEICHGLVDKSLKFVSKIIKKLHEYQFQTFLIGCTIPTQIIKSDESLKSINKDFNSLKFEIRKEIGLRIQLVINQEVEFQNPDITIVVDLINSRFNLQIKSLYILGKYKKYTRGLPQTKWPCTHCKGKGCRGCSDTGQQYSKTVETLISKSFLNSCHANDASFHGAGREDIDALMLGTGRPFVLEVKKPKIRNLDLLKLQKEVNSNPDIDIEQLSICDKSIIAKLKEGSSDSKKTYRAISNTEQLFDSIDLKKINEYGGIPQTINQRTPRRVSHRRADKIRMKEIYGVTVKQIGNTLLELTIIAQGGAYIKEFISGDGGRTIPSISSIIDKPIVCIALDVLEVYDHGFFD